MRHVPGLPYPLPDRGNSNEGRHFDLWLGEISERPPHILGADLTHDGVYPLSVGDRVRTTDLWAELHDAPVQYAVITKVALTKTGKRMAQVYPVGPSLLPATGVWLPADDLEVVVDA